MFILFYFYKFTGWLFNLLVVIFGGLILGAGVYATIETSAYSNSLSVSNIVTQPAIMFIVLGLVLVIIGIIGIIGTLRELRIFLWIYIVIVGLILLLEVALIGYLVWNFTQNKEEFNMQVKTAFTPHIEMYREDDDLRALVDLLQEGLECCGINLYADWENNRYFNCSAPGVERCGVPSSCCKKELQINTQCGYSVRDPSMSDRLDSINLNSCSQAFTDFLISNQITLGIIGGVLLLVQVSAIVLSLLLSFEIPNKRADERLKKLREDHANHHRSHSEQPHHRPSHSEHPQHRPSHSEQPQHRPSHSEQPQHRPSHSEQPHHRPSHSEHPQHRPSHSEHPQHRPSHSEHPQHRPSHSEQPQHRPSHSEQPQHRPSHSEHPQHRPSHSEHPQHRPSHSEHPQHHPSNGEHPSHHSSRAI